MRFTSILDFIINVDNIAGISIDFSMQPASYDIQEEFLLNLYIKNREDTIFIRNNNYNPFELFVKNNPDISLTIDYETSFDVLTMKFAGRRVMKLYDLFRMEPTTFELTFSEILDLPDVESAIVYYSLK